ncbi:MAG TPA: reverse transcriptase domain-containing protein, partial [Candidatus Polarisedimenticolia bacterium]|nr:reverse transcriptase domain-containing protein [Candidatus Polarisedimenticolia bacterium]
MSEIPVHSRPRRLVDWINPTGARKVHSLVDKVYKRKNLEMAWEKVKANRGSGGVDGQNLEAFAVQLDQQLNRLQSELKEDTYQPQPVRQVQIPKAGKPGEFRTLGIPTIYDRVCQQALLNRLEPIFEPIFDDANFGYRRGRSTKDAMRKVWKEIDGGQEWIVDGDLKDFFGSVDHVKLLTLVAQRIADGRVLRLIEAMLKAGSYGKGRLFPSERGTPQGGVVTPRTQKVTCLLGGSRRGRVRRLRIIGIRTDQWDWERVADGKTVCIDENFFDQQSQDLLAFVNVYSFCPCTELPSKSIQALCKLHISNLVHCCR